MPKTTRVSPYTKYSGINTKQPPTPDGRVPCLRSWKEQEEQRRRAAGMPYPLDVWLTDALANRRKTPDSVIETSDALCVFTVECKKAEPNPTIFEDPDLYTLRVVALIRRDAGVPQSCVSSPCAIVATYEGWNTTFNAPEWTKWPLGEDREVILKRGYVGQMFFMLALFRPNLLEALKSVQLIEWARAVMVGTNYEVVVREFATRHQFPFSSRIRN